MREQGEGEGGGRMGQQVAGRGSGWWGRGVISLHVPGREQGLAVGGGDGGWPTANELHVAKASAHIAHRHTIAPYMPATVVGRGAITHHPDVNHAISKSSAVEDTVADSLPSALNRPRLALAYTNEHLAHPHQPCLLTRSGRSRSSVTLS